MGSDNGAAAGYRQPQPPAHALAHLGEHQAVGQPMPHSQPRVDALALPGPIVVTLAHGHRPPEQPLTHRAAALDPVEYPPMGVLVHAGHREQHGGPDRLQVRRQRLDGTRERAHVASGRRHEVLKAAEGMGQRQELQRHGVLADRHGGQRRCDREDVVAVGGEDTLGLAGGARGVDDGEVVVGLECRRRLAECSRVLAAVVPPRGLELLQRHHAGGGGGLARGVVRVQEHRGPDRRQRRRRDVEPFQGGPGIHHQHRGLRMLHDVLDLGRRVGGVEGHGQGADADVRPVQQAPLHAIGSEHGHALALPHARGHQAQGDALHLGGGLAPGLVAPPAVAPEPVEHALRPRVRLGQEKIGKASIGHAGTIAQRAHLLPRPRACVGKTRGGPQLPPNSRISPQTYCCWDTVISG